MLKHVNFAMYPTCLASVVSSLIILQEPSHSESFQALYTLCVVEASLTSVNLSTPTGCGKGPAYQSHSKRGSGRDGPSTCAP